jgi:NAD(P)-dependent dehydrogenase (short-subunit alcohol dehydrogenase family)
LISSKNQKKNIFKTLNRTIQAQGFSCDASSEESIKQAFTEIQETFNDAPVEVLIYNVAVFSPKKFMDIQANELGVLMFIL